MSRKFTNEIFIKKAKQIHGERYEYADVKYDGQGKKVKIRCFKHGIFEQLPLHHLSGKGCRLCGNKKLSTSDFIERAHKIHGDKYDYSQTDYVNLETEVTIGCKIHGYLKITPHSHLSTSGCKICNDRTVTKEEYIEKARLEHGDKYDYSLINSADIKAKIKIICKTHGVFEQRLFNHLSGSSCPSCAGNKKLTTEEFISKARAVYGDRYDYSKSVYKNNSTKMIITCKEHGDFERSPYVFLTRLSCLECKKLGYV